MPRTSRSDAYSARVGFEIRTIREQAARCLPADYEPGFNSSTAAASWAAAL